MLSPELKAFLQSYIEWIDAGAPWDLRFDKRTGLCANVRTYYRGNSALEERLNIELRHIFRWENLHIVFPFNIGTRNSYYDEYNSESAHENPYRLTFVRRHLENA